MLCVPAAPHSVEATATSLADSTTSENPRPQLSVVPAATLDDSAIDPTPIDPVAGSPNASHSGVARHHLHPRLDTALDTARNTALNAGQRWEEAQRRATARPSELAPRFSVTDDRPVPTGDSSSSSVAELRRAYEGVSGPAGDGSTSSSGGTKVETLKSLFEPPQPKKRGNSGQKWEAAHGTSQKQNRGRNGTAQVGPR